jgi:hypothetical protein
MSVCNFVMSCVEDPIRMRLLSFHGGTNVYNFNENIHMITIIDTDSEKSYYS